MRTPAYAILRGLLVAATLVTFGCAGSGQSPVADPAASAFTDLPEALSAPLDPTAGAALLAGTLTVDADTLTADLGIRRSPALDFPLDITPYLTIEPCRDCFRVKSVRRGPAGTVDLILGMRHPFDAAVRPDLDAFDPRLILGTSATLNFDLFPPGKDGGTPRVTPFGVPNADGYTGRLKELVGTTVNGSKNPYINFFTDDNPDPFLQGAAIPFHRLGAGFPEDFRLLRLDPAVLGNPIQINWIIEAHYGQSATRPTRFTPVYRNPQFNRKEAYALRVSVPLNTLQEGVADSSATIRVEVEDWQQNAPLAADPDNPQPHEIEAPSFVERIILDLPGIFPAPQQRNTADGGEGTADDPFVYVFDIVSDGSIPAGTYTGLVQVDDALDPFSTTFEYKVFQVFRLSVLEENPPPQKGTWDWSTPATQVNNQPGLSYLWPKEGIALDQGGVAHIVWTDDSTGDDRAYYARQTAAGSATFTAAQDFAGGSGATLYPTIAVDLANTVHIVWEDGRDQANGSNIYYGTRTTTGNSMAAILPLTQFDENIFGLFPKVYARTPGTAHVIWSDHRTDPQVFPFGVANFGVYYARVDVPAVSNPELGDAETVVDDVQAEGFPNLTVLSDGTVCAVYQANALSGTGNRRVWFAKSDPGQPFDAPVAVHAASVDGGQPDIAHLSTGELWAVYGRGQTFNSILLVRSDDGGATWVDTSTFSEGGTPGYWQVVPDIAVDPQDNLHVVWHELNPTTLEPGRVQLRTRYFDGELGTTTFLTPEGVLAAFPSVAVAPNRDLGVAYQRWTGDQYEIFHKVGLFVPE